jgi:signal transduction histidine kinase
VDDIYASLYEHVSSGVVRVRDGLIQYANPAASHFLSAIVGQPFGHPLLDQMARAAGRRIMTLPLRFEVPAPSRPPDISATGLGPLNLRPDVINAVIVTAPWFEEEVLVLLSNQARANHTETALANFIAHIASETRRPIEQLLHDLELKSTDGAGDDGGTARRAIHNATLLHRKLLKIRDLVQVLGRSSHEEHERVLLGALVNRAMDDAGSLAFARDVTVRLKGTDAPSPVIYGSHEWLSKAVAEYLEHVIQSSPPGSEVEVSLHATGTRALLRARTGMQTFDAISGKASHRAGPHSSATERGAVATTAPNARITALSLVPSIRFLPSLHDDHLSIGLALSQRIVEQHGGSVRIEDEFDVVDVVMELPAGAPASEDARLSLEQATRYARSVSDLLAHSLARNTPPR